jgi:glycine/D-amino acid oxidase-like deaminating enzyme
MKAFTNKSIDLMEEIANASNDQINMTRRGYLLATRSGDIGNFTSDLMSSCDDQKTSSIRFHDANSTSCYQAPLSPAWQDGLDNVDILSSPTLIQKHYPSLDSSIANIIHIRRAGTISSQQLGQYMLEQFRALGGKRQKAMVTTIEKSSTFKVTTEGNELQIQTEKIVNAAGPFAGKISRMLGIELPIKNILHQKIAFPDTANAIPRGLPFSIDLDAQHINWTDEEKSLLQEETSLNWLTQTMPGSIHCRPDGGDKGTWIKLGWAYNQKASVESFEPTFDDHFPEIVLRGASRLHPTLKTYLGHLPRETVHYGGYYTMTEENWPLIGPTDVDGFYIHGAMSGFGTMAACAGGELCAQWVLDLDLPKYAPQLSLKRYANTTFMNELLQRDRGIL